uniref:Pentapeptide repeat-containing protein n=1 Tax=Desertifilum tharense IPPAS B-1220 TaxID=1781255 RepID=A0ACD5GQU8_9CYAN
MEFNPSQLLALAGRTAVLSPNSFWLRVRYSLKSIQLSGTYLYRALLAGGNLQAADLSASVLVEANLVGANLKEANLSWANLTGANLTGANLTGANLEGANLMGANLQRCNLQSTQLNNACLVETQMDESSWDIARAKGLSFLGSNTKLTVKRSPLKVLKKNPRRILLGMMPHRFYRLKWLKMSR